MFAYQNTKELEKDSKERFKPIDEEKVEKTSRQQNLFFHC